MPRTHRSNQIPIAYGIAPFCPVRILFVSKLPVVESLSHLRAPTLKFSNW